MEKIYKRRVFVGNTLYEAEMFYIPYFKLEKGILKCVSKEVPKKFSWLKSLTENKEVYFGVLPNYKQGVYYINKSRLNKESFLEDFTKGLIIHEY